MWLWRCTKSWPVFVTSTDIGGACVADLDVPAPATFCERKTVLLGRLFCFKKFYYGVEATKLHLDSKKVEVVNLVRVKRTAHPGAYGHDHIHDTRF